MLKCVGWPVLTGASEEWQKAAKNRIRGDRRLKRTPPREGKSCKTLKVFRTLHSIICTWKRFNLGSELVQKR